MMLSIVFIHAVNGLLNNAYVWPPCDTYYRGQNVEIRFNYDGIYESMLLWLVSGGTGVGPSTYSYFTGNGYYYIQYQFQGTDFNAATQFQIQSNCLVSASVIPNRPVGGGA